MRKKRWHIDLPLLLGLFLLSILSLVVLYSAGGESKRVLFNQGVRIFVSFAVMLLIAQMHPSTLMRWSPYIYGCGLLMLFLVLEIGVTGKGAKRWLDLGLFRFQPSELMKLAVPMMVAWVLTRRGLPPNFRGIVSAIIVLVIPAYLILKQPDLGTAILITLSGLVIIFLAGFSWRLIAYLLILLLISAPFLWGFFT